MTSTATDQLIESDGVDALLGPATSPSTSSIIDKIRTAGVLTCGGSATAGDLVDRRQRGVLLPHGAARPVPGPGPGRVGPARRPHQRRHRRPQRLLRRRPGRVGGGGVGRRRARPLSGEIVAYDPAGTDFDADVQAVLDGSPDAVIVIGFSDDGARVLSTMIERGIGPADMPIYVTDGLDRTNPGLGHRPGQPGRAQWGARGHRPGGGTNGGIDSPFSAASSVCPIVSASTTTPPC